jgi:TonB family protein
MSVLFNDARARPRTRSSTGLWLSVMLHATFAGVLTAVVPTRASERPSRPPSIPVFVLPPTELVKLPSIPLEAPRLPAPPVPETMVAKVPKPAVTPIATKPVEPAPAALLPAKAPARPLETRAPERPPETGLFERANGPRAGQPTAAVATGGFGSGVPLPRATGQSAAAVATGGFGSGASSPHGTAQSTGTVATGGFGSGASSPRGTGHGVDSGNVQTAGFDLKSAPVQSPGAAAAAPRPIDRPVEITFKPTPEYTDEARSARIEGTVSLELEFTALGDVRVLRVVRGLGHGLDEAAERAALRIRFKPAQSDGRSVDSRATVHITFRLS